MPRGKKASCRGDGGGHKPLNSAAEELRVCPVIPSARDREVRGLLAAEPAFAFAGTRSRSVTVRSNGYGPQFCQYGGWTVAAVRKTDNFLCVCTHDHSLRNHWLYRLRLLPDLLSQLCGLKPLKYTKYVCGFQILICAKISRHQLLPK